MFRCRQIDSSKCDGWSYSSQFRARDLERSTSEEKHAQGNFLRPPDWLLLSDSNSTRNANGL